MAYILTFAALAVLVVLLFRLLTAGSATSTVPGADPDGPARPCDSAAQTL